LIYEKEGRKESLYMNIMIHQRWMMKTNSEGEREDGDFFLQIIANP
jgi:hypothetical protein